MNRRAFLITPLVLALPSPVKSKELLPREFYRYNYPLDNWTKITRYDIQPNDVLRVFDPPDGIDDIVHVTRVELEEFFIDLKIDKKTNKWVSPFVND